MNRLERILIALLVLLWAWAALCMAWEVLKRL